MMLLLALTLASSINIPGANGSRVTEAALDATGGPVLARLSDGAPICGLGAAFHTGRRAELARRLETGYVLVRGLPETRDYTEFRQDKTFWYLTGIESPDATLFMDVDAGTEILFLPDRDRRQEVWDGELWDAEDEWVGELTGFEDVRASSGLMEFLREKLSEGDKVWISKEPWVALSGGFDRAEPADRRRKRDPLDGRASREQALGAKLVEHFSVEVASLRGPIDAMRLIKTPEEIEAMRRAARAGSAAMVEAIRSTRPDLGEWELDALMEWIQVREGADGPAYLAIVGSGPNSCTLHYSASARRMRDGEMMLIDFGPEVDHYTTDLTRTWPVNGRWTERQAELYDAVLAAQEASIAAVKPGVTLGQVGEAGNAVLRERGFASLIRHGVSHWIGLEVHDVGDYSVELAPGMTFTVEPGAYEAETGIGIRIEDVVVVTEDGCEVLSASLPKDRETLSKLVAEQGVLDWMDASSE